MSVFQIYHHSIWCSIKSEGTVTALSKKNNCYSSGMAFKTQTAIPNFILSTELTQHINSVFGNNSIGTALALLNLAVEIPMQLQKCLRIIVTAILRHCSGHGWDTLPAWGLGCSTKMYLYSTGILASCC